MKEKFFSFVVITALVYLVSCHTAKQPITENGFIVGIPWRLVELNGKTIMSGGQLKKEPYLILNASEKRVNGNGGCNSFFGSFELQGVNGITFSKIGATRMACSNEVLVVEHQLFQVLEMIDKFTLLNDTLLLTKTDMLPLAKFVVSDTK